MHASASLLVSLEPFGISYIAAFLLSLIRPQKIGKGFKNYVTFQVV
jgi:hypothetical protein